MKSIAALAARAILIAFCLATHATDAQSQPAAYESPEPALERAAARHFDAIGRDPVALQIRLRAMPKGGDLHNHLTGAVYAESYLRWAAEDGLCVDSATLRLVPPESGACARGTMPAAQFVQNVALYRQFVDAASMRDFIAGAPLSAGIGKPNVLRAGDASGHDHFFNAFGEVRGARAGRGGDMLAEVANRAAQEGVTYLELMISPGMRDAIALAESPALALQEQWDRLQAPLAPVIAQARDAVTRNESRMRELLGCGGAAPQPGCRVTIRYLSEVNRGASVNQVFAQGVLANRLGAEDPRFVGFNLVGPEDAPDVLKSYRDQMTVLAWLHRRAPDLPLALHAGELSEGLVPPEDLAFHIREAVMVAGARRIGHGVDLAFEQDPQTLLQWMARRNVAVEINLTSNDLILGVRGNRHPLGQYLRAGVPVVFSTDDPGVSRITLTHEFVKAIMEHSLDYRTIKSAVRNSLEFAFVEGPSLWVSEPGNARRVTPACRNLASEMCAQFVQGSTRARLQRDLELALIDFERGLQ